ncbi:MAG: hypothetical protein M3133_10420, partial [Actinomycetota bacterium]|nr:hypothetical protein [Actinomycetota bacterium]
MDQHDRAPLAPQRVDGDADTVSGGNRLHDEQFEDGGVAPGPSLVMLLKRLRRSRLEGRAVRGRRISRKGGAATQSGRSHDDQGGVRDLQLVAPPALGQPHHEG